MTHKDYALIAKCLLTIEDNDLRSDLANHFSAEFAVRDPRFNPYKFLMTCLAKVPLLPEPKYNPKETCKC